MDIVEKIWNGDETMDAWTKAVAGGHREIVTKDVMAISTSYFFGNVTAIRTSAGLVLIDTGSLETGQETFDTLRKWSREPIQSIIYTHGHIDHICGAQLYDAEADLNGWERPRIIAHRNVLNRFERYDHTRALNTRIMGKQFNNPAYEFPDDYRRPNEIYDDRLELTVGNTKLVLAHGQGETDDATYVWLPAEKILISGDFVIWALPNAGNPRKVQRYAPHWAGTLRRMIALRPNVLVPGHGPVVYGAQRVEQILADGATVLEHLVTETLRLMNQGMNLNQVIRSVRAPATLLEKPYLSPRYDDPEFIVRGIWHLFAGWYDGNPAHLKPANDHELASVIARMTGGVEALLAQAEEAARSNNLRLAAHLIEFAHMAAPSNVAVHSSRESIYSRISEAEESLIGRALFAIPARESKNFVMD